MSLFDRQSLAFAETYEPRGKTSSDEPRKLMVVQFPDFTVLSLAGIPRNDLTGPHFPEEA